LGTTFFRFADGCDTFLFWFGVLWAFAFGAALPGFCIIFGGLIDDMGTMGVGEQKENPLKKNSLYMIYVAGGTWVTSGCYISALAVYSESIAHKLKIKYFEKALYKDAAFYDTQNPNEMAAKINKEAQAVRRGLSEKIGNICMSISGFILGYAAAFIFGWKLALILLGGLPFILCSGIAFGLSLQTGTVEQMKAYSQSAGYAEQAL
jgi:ABC-type multidrug transport system fused ATPase/permease subunit